MSDALLSLNDDEEYMQEFNERIDVLMSVRSANSGQIVVVLLKLSVGSGL